MVCVNNTFAKDDTLYGSNDAVFGDEDTKQGHGNVLVKDDDQSIVPPVTPGNSQTGPPVEKNCLLSTRKIDVEEDTEENGKRENGRDNIEVRSERVHSNLDIFNELFPPKSSEKPLRHRSADSASCCKEESPTDAEADMPREPVVRLKSCIFSTPRLSDESDENCNGQVKKKAKSVHFADTIGKPLRDIKTMSMDEEMFSLSFGLMSIKKALSQEMKTDNRYQMSFKYGPTFGNVREERGKLMNFPQPQPQSHDFQRKVFAEKICLEHVVFREAGVFATACVTNMSFEKSVTIRYTIDQWKTTRSIIASFVHGSSTGSTDTFSFEIPYEDSEVDVEVQFAMCFETSGVQFWDNNHEKNYILKVFGRKKKDKVQSGGDGFNISNHGFIGWST